MNALSPARSPAKSVPLVPAKADPVLCALDSRLRGNDGALLRGRGGSLKWKHCPHVNLVDSCNENLPTFAIHQICACSLLSSLAGVGRRQKRLQAQVVGEGWGPSASRAVLCYLPPCIFPVINKDASKNCSMHPLVVEGSAGGSLHVFVYGA